MRILVLLVQFSDHVGRQLPPRSHFVDLCNDEIAPYLISQSFGRLNVEGCDVHDWQTVQDTEAVFADGRMGLKSSGEVAKLFEPVLDALDVAGEIDWSAHDRDNNGKMDIVLAIHSGFAAEQGIGKKCNAPDSLDRVVSQGHMGQNDGWINSSGLIQLSSFAVASAFDRVCDETNWASMGVMTHEIIHTFRTLPSAFDHHD